MRQGRPHIFKTMILGLMLTLMSTAAVLAGDAEGGQAGEFLRYGADVRSLGMGRAYVALADDASALYYNPSGLMGLKRGYSFYAMHFKPLYESNYNFFSFALSRVDPNATGLTDFFFGPKAAWGFSIIHMGSDGYELRDGNDVLQGEFDIYQQAFMLAFAREASGTAGILNYGVTFKLVRQGLGQSLDENESSFGLDAGLQFQMLNPPLIKELSRVPLIGPFFQLKHLMPLRLGLAIRNVISPELGYGGESDEWPTALRVGASYGYQGRFLPRNTRLVLVGDAEWLYADMDRLIRFDRRIEIHDVAPGAGQYLGTEFQYRTDKLSLSPRMGLSHVFDEWTISAGLGVALSDVDIPGLGPSDLQFDFAHGHHDNLADDQRISLTIRFGGKRDASYYYNGSETKTNLSPTVNLLHTVSAYPENPCLVLFARDSLAQTLDTLNRMRYLEMFIDLSLGNNWYLQARHELENGNEGLAGQYANWAIDAYQEVLTGGGTVVECDEEDNSAVFTDNHSLNHAEAHAIAAITDPGNAEKHWRKARDLASSASGEALRSNYLQGLAAKSTGDISNAIEHFRAAVNSGGQEKRSMRMLSRYQLGLCLMEQGQTDSGIDILKTFYEDPNSTTDSLAAHYPRFPAYPDRRLSDDALYRMGEYYMDKGDDRKALLSFGNICRFYPDLDKCKNSDIEKKISELTD